MTSTTDPQALLLQLLDPSNRADPYPAYNTDPRERTVAAAGHDLTVFSSFDHCDEILRHPSSANDRSKSTIVQREIADGAEPQQASPSFLFLDPPDHTRLRRLVSKAFVPKVVKALEPDIAGWSTRFSTRRRPTASLTSSPTWPIRCQSR